MVGLGQMELGLTRSCCQTCLPHLDPHSMERRQIAGLLDLRFQEGPVPLKMLANCSSLPVSLLVPVLLLHDAKDQALGESS